MKKTLNGNPSNIASKSEPLLYRIGNAMEQLAVSRATIYRMVARGELDLVRISLRTSRITSESVHRLLGSQRSQSLPPGDPGSNAPDQ